MIVLFDPNSYDPCVVVIVSLRSRVDPIKKFLSLFLLLFFLLFSFLSFSFSFLFFKWASHTSIQIADVGTSSRGMEVNR